MWTPFDLPILASVALSAWYAGRFAAARRARNRNDILSVVAHDLRNPLSVISSSSSLLLEQPELVPAQRARTLQMTQRAVGQMDRLISDLLDATRLDTGQLRLDRARVDARAILHQIEETFGQAALDRQIALQCVVPVGECLVCADSDRVLQAIGNLVGNALKFTPRHGLITVSTARRGPEVVFSVADTGSGISTADQLRVFDRFFQTRKGDLRGVGLGLSITKGIVEAHGGRIWLDSAVGLGTTFYFTVPALSYTPLVARRPGMLPRLSAPFRNPRKEPNTCSTPSTASGAASSVLRLLGSQRRASA